MIDNVFEKIYKINHTHETPGELNIFIFSFLIGCKTYQNSVHKYIHEFPLLCRDLFTNPEKKIKYLKYEKLNVYQYLYLIDLQYEFSKPLFLISSLEHIMASASSAITETLSIAHSETVKSFMEIYVHPKEITTVFFTDVLNVLTPFLNRNKNILINIQDTTSAICENISVFNTSKYIHILPPECFLNTSEVYACPEISMIGGKIGWLNIRDNKYNLLPTNQYLMAVYKFLNFKYYLPSLLSLWTIWNLNVPLYNIMTGDVIDPITNQNFSMSYDNIILPYIKYRFCSSDFFIYILYFIGHWKEYYMFPECSKLLTFQDIISNECSDRLKFLCIAYPEPLNLNDFRTILKNAQGNI